MLPPLSFSPSFGLTFSSLFEVATWIIESLMQAFQCCIFPCQRCLTCFPHTLLYCFSFYSVTSVFTISFDTSSLAPGLLRNMEFNSQVFRDFLHCLSVVDFQFDFVTVKEHTLYDSSPCRGLFYGSEWGLSW